MDNLPKEIWRLVLFQCDDEMLRKLRLVSQQLINITIPEVSETVYIGWRKDSIERLKAISLHSVLRYHVDPL